MRFLILTMLAAGALLAQTAAQSDSEKKPAQPLSKSPSTESKDKDQEKTAPPAAASLVISPAKNPCAMGVINVLPRDQQTSRMPVYRVPGRDALPMKEVSLPAPSCDDVGHDATSRPSAPAGSGSGSGPGPGRLPR